MTYITAIAIYLVAVNLVTFIMYGVDKHKAQSGKWRIPEATLILFSFIGGAAGALLGMLLFHHKTKHPKFYILVPLFLILQLAALFLLMRSGVLS